MALVRTLSRRRLFYGWYIVALAFLAQFVNWGQTINLSVFLKPMAQELGWSRAWFMGVQAQGTLITGGLAPVVGPALDRHGGRWVMLGGGLVIGAGLMAVSLVQELWHFYLLRGVVVTTG